MNNALSYALKLLAKKDYTEAELRQKFKIREFEEEEAERALLFLAEKKFLDDRRYATLYRNSHRTRGDIRIRFELVRKGIPEDIIAEVLSEPRGDEEQYIRELAVSWIEKKRGKYPDKFKLKANLIAKLSRQGFGYDMILKSIDDLLG